MERGLPVLRVRTDAIPSGHEILVGFPFAKTEPADALGVITGKLLKVGQPYCVPAPR